MTTSTLNLPIISERDDLARQIADTYTSWKNERVVKEKAWAELRNYIFATDTTTTSNAPLPWKNKTTRPKLTQIRDNLQANYMAALFPTENWFKWQAGNEQSAIKEKAVAVESYMRHKLKESGFEETVSRLVNDWIDYGNCIADIEYVNETQTDIGGNVISVYSGPRLIRISPLDLVFDIKAASFEQSPKITRTLLSFGQVEKLRRTNPEWKQIGDDVMEKIKNNRREFLRSQRSMDPSDTAKLNAINADGFSSLADYYRSGYVEFLEFEGDLYDTENHELYENHVITCVDRVYVARKAPISNWFGKSYKRHCGWRLRPDNLMAMGPLDNLVGLQYRMDHLENLKADAFDLIAFPPLKVKGFVEDFQWQPMERIYMEQDSDVESLAPNTTALNAELQIDRIEQTMEEMAGAPKQAMGLRTPGEKTAFEVQALENASGRIFQNKAMYFEKNFLEPLLNSFLEIARRNMQQSEVIKVIDDEHGILDFIKITPDDIRAKGRIVPMGARHFAAQSQLVQNLSNLSATNVYQDPMIQQHFSSVQIAKLIEENLNLERFKIVRPFVRLEEQMEATSKAQQMQEDLAVEAMTPAVTMDDLTEEAPVEGAGAPVNG